MSDERRRSERQKVLLEARWLSLSTRHEARVDDVSMSGCFVNTYGPVEIGERVDLSILLGSGEWLPLSGYIATYQHGVGFGMAFTDLTPEKEKALLLLLASASEER
jgi:hypothetical protein